MISFFTCLQVEVRDVVEAFRLLEVAMQQSATDHATGQTNLLSAISYAFFSCNHNIKCWHFYQSTTKGTIDMDLIMTGISASERQRRDNLVAATRNLVMEKMQLGGPSVRMIEVKNLQLVSFVLIIVCQTSGLSYSSWLISQLLEEIRKQSSMEVHLHDVSWRSSLHCLHWPDTLGGSNPFLNFPSSQLRGALGTLMTEGAVVIHGDSVKRVWCLIICDLSS